MEEGGGGSANHPPKTPFWRFCRLIFQIQKPVLLEDVPVRTLPRHQSYSRISLHAVSPQTSPIWGYPRVHSPQSYSRISPRALSPDTVLFEDIPTCTLPRNQSYSRISPRALSPGGHNRAPGLHCRNNVHFLKSNFQSQFPSPSTPMYIYSTTMISVYIINGL